MYYRHFHPLSGQNTIMLQEISSSHRPRFGPSRANIHMSIFVTAHFSPAKVGLKVVCVNPPSLFLHPLWSRVPSSLTICIITMQTYLQWCCQSVQVESPKWFTGTQIGRHFFPQRTSFKSICAKIFFVI